MYLLSQLVLYMFLTFLLGIAVGYALWRSWGEREVIAKYNAAEMRLAAHMARWEQTAQRETTATPRMHAPYQPPQPAPMAAPPQQSYWNEPPRRAHSEFEPRSVMPLKEAKEALQRRSDTREDKPPAGSSDTVPQEPRAFASPAAVRQSDEAGRREPPVVPFIISDQGNGTAAAGGEKA